MAEGTTVNRSFTFKDLGISTVPDLSQNEATLTQLTLVLKNASGSTIATLGGSGSYPLPIGSSNATVQVSSLLNSGTPYNYANVSSITITWKFNSASVEPSNLAFDDITVANISSSAATNAAAPTITTQPADKTVNVNATANLTVAATASGTLSYQWYSNATNSSTGGSAISGATSATYSAPTGTAGTTYYYVVVTNTDTSQTGNQTANAASQVAKVTVAALTNAAAPTITTQPADKTVNVNATANLTVAATASGTLSYQWYSNATNSSTGGSAISGATSATYSAPTGTAGTTYYYVVVTNTDTSQTGNQTANTTSQVAKVTVSALTNAVAPTITMQPADQNVNVNETANLTVAATASGTLSFQWYSSTTNSTTGGSAISGATSATYSAPTGTAGTTYYYVVVTNTDTSQTGNQTAKTTSRVATVTVAALTDAAAPTITTQPADQNVNVNETANLTVAATASGTLSYQWYINNSNSAVGGVLISGATNATYSASTSNAGTDYYYVVVTNTDTSQTGDQTASTTSRVATVTVNSLTNAAAPTITMQPADKNVNMNDAASLSVSATASGTLSFQWYSNTTNSVIGGSAISGATAGTYSAPTGTAGTTYYYVVVTNTDTSQTGNQTASITSQVAKVTVAALTNATAPTVSAQPSDRSVNAGETAELSIEAYGSGTLSYQWYSSTTDSSTGGTPIPGATGAKYTAPTGTAGTSYYYVVVTNTDPNQSGEQQATVTSRVVTVKVAALNDAPAPELTAQPSDQSVGAGGTARLSVTAAGSGELSYQWYRNSTNSITGGTAIGGATSAAYTAPTGTAGTTYYYVVVTNTDPDRTGQKTASTTSRAAAVTVVSNSSNTGGGSNSTGTPTTPPTTPPSTPAATSGATVLVNGVPENSGSAVVSQDQGRSVTTIQLDEQKLQQRIDAAGTGAVITIPVSAQTSVIVGELNARIVKGMEEKQATLEIRTDQAAYTLPASQINVDAISAQLGGSAALQDIAVRVRIAEPTADQAALVQRAASAGSFEIAAPTFDFSVQAVYQNRTIEVNKFDAYVERMIALPDGTDPNRITTGVVVEPDGSVRHVPTRVTQVDGRYYAVINSLTNSLYSVVWHPYTFNDLNGHWAENIIDNMGSRMIVNGVADHEFMPDQSITRAEFAAILVRGLGLTGTAASGTFSDIQPSDESYEAIRTAAAYGLVNGFADGTFHPSDRITREQAMTMIVRATELTGLKSGAAGSDLSNYRDAGQVASWARASTELSVQLGIAQGRSASVLAPKSWLTRAETAVMVERLLRKSNLI
ncbi:S-layer homology domain-containing protein [Saccharibacillus sp. CPCC 101409]|uniref:S-layer homology domain-containing protein n=1 Tax=Saccharibacillus sp. CPCC 101409 TaxID=3058041 RepID=UPI00267247AD|nr:S-layer homology domain-containing protein [Saccharibacillus sp. CPCC 101409]MDO3410550.1 S-layer homology domain-containing protein [Saccharibacillus sp. CPCC 101409]